MTQRLYYDAPHLREFTAHVQETDMTERGPAVRLDRTAFYPTSGGQPHDTGTLNGVAVTDVWEDESAQIWHLLAAPLDAAEIHGAIDWPRRFDHMQQHTGQHMLSAAFHIILGAETVGFHLGAESSTIDLDLDSLDWETAFRIEHAVNSVVWQDRPVTVHTLTQDDVSAVPLRKAPQVSGTVRVITVEGYDASACGGTHVAHTGEIGLIKITSLERYKRGTRVAFLCGERALRDYQRALYGLQRIAADLSVAQEDVGATLARLQEELREARRSLHKSREQLLTLDAERLWAESAEVGDVRKIVAYRPADTFDDIRTLASLLRSQARTVVLLSAAEGDATRMVCARSDDLPHLDATRLLRRALAPLNGRGGGSNGLAQGGAPSHPREQVVQAMETALNEALERS